MAEYTTMVRTICEQKAGLEESKGGSYVDSVIADSWDKIFTTSAAFFDPAYKPVICKKILKHYYMREIGAETAGLWILWMNTRLEEILPYYNKLWSSALLEFDPFNDTNYSKTGTRSGSNTEKQNGSFGRTDSSTTITSPGVTTTTRDLYSDTPQGALTGVENETYLTDARKTTTSRTGSDEDNTNASQMGTTENNTKGETTESYLETVAGKMASTPYAELLQKYRDTFLNIDLMVIKEFEDLFFGLW